MRNPETAGWEPGIYPSKIRAEIEDYDVLQSKVVEAARGREVAAILDLGTGEGETARRVLAEYPDARLHGIDSSEAMVVGARERLPSDRVTVTLQDLQDPLPEGRFDLAISALAIHHLEGELKLDLFTRIAAVLTNGGRFVLGDLVAPEDPGDAVIELTNGYDFPSTASQQVAWLEQAGFRVEMSWQRNDLAVFIADKN